MVLGRGPGGSPLAEAAVCEGGGGVLGFEVNLGGFFVCLARVAEACRCLGRGSRCGGGSGVWGSAGGVGAAPRGGRWARRVPASPQRSRPRGAAATAASCRRREAGGVRSRLGFG